MNVRALTQAFEANDKKAVSPPTSPPRSKGGKLPLRISTPSLRSEEEIRASAASAAAQASQAAAVANASRRKSPPSGLITPNSARILGRPKLTLEPSMDAAPQSSLTSGPALSTVATSPSTITPTPTSSLPTPPDTAALASRRAERYNRDEQQLVAAATPDLPEFSPRTLQKFELARAQGLLAEQAAIARARVVELKKKLARHDLSPEEHTALQQERWKQERWADAAEQQLARVKDVEAVLKETPTPQTIVASASVKTDKPAAAVTDAEARRQANLAKFFAQSPTHVTAHTRNRSRVMLLTSHPAGREPTLELKLRVWPIGAELRRQSSANLRPRSVDGGKTRDGPPASERLGHGSARKKSRRVPPALPLADEVPSASAEQDWVHSAPAHTGVIRFPRAPPVHVDYTLDETPDGKAVVYNRTVLPTREEILAGAPIDAGPVAMPSYVSALLDEFDFDISDVVSALALPKPEPPRAPEPKLSRPSTARISAARPSTTRMSAAPTRISSASPPMLPVHTPLPLLTLTLSRRASIDTLGSAVLVSRPSVDSYHYPQQRTSKLRISRSLRSSMHFGGGSSSTTVVGDGGEEGSRSPRMRKPSFLRPRTASSGEDGVGVMDRVRKRVSVLGKR